MIAREIGPATRHPTDEITAEEYVRLAPALERELAGWASRFGRVDEHVIEDVCAETWRKALETLRRAGRKGPLMPLLWAIALRTLRDMQARGWGRFEQAQDPGDGVLALAIDRAALTELAAEVRICDAETERLLAALPMPDRAVIVMSVCWGWKAGEIRRALEISRKGYERARSRALYRLADALVVSRSEGFREALGRLISRIQDGETTAQQMLMARHIATAGAELRRVPVRLGDRRDVVGASDEDREVSVPARDPRRRPRARRRLQTSASTRLSAGAPTGFAGRR